MSLVNDAVVVFKNFNHSATVIRKSFFDYINLIDFVSVSRYRL